MMNEKTRRTAERFNIIDKVEKLQRELLQIDGVIDVEFDIDGFYDNIGDFIFLTKYDIPVTVILVKRNINIGINFFIDYL